MSLKNDILENEVDQANSIPALIIRYSVTEQKVSTTPQKHAKYLTLANTIAPL